MMKKIKNFMLVITFSFITINVQQAQTFSPDIFISPGADRQVQTFWHWINGAISKEGITKDLEAMKHAGVSEAKVFGIHLGDSVRDVPYIAFNSPEWFSMFSWALHEAERLGIKITAHTCEGWSTAGGPWVKPEYSMKEFVWTENLLDENSAKTIKLDQPTGKLGFYKDVAVVAYKTSQKKNNFHRNKPIIRYAGENTNAILYDGCPVSGIKILKNQELILEFENAFSAEKIVMLNFLSMTHKAKLPSFELSYSNDGITYHSLLTNKNIKVNQLHEYKFTAAKARFYKIIFDDPETLNKKYPIYLSELEILPDNENPLCDIAISDFTAKAAFSSTQDNQIFSFPQNKINAETIHPDDIVILTDYLKEDGTLAWKKPKGQWKIIRFGYTTNGFVNSPASVYGEGLEVDKMDTMALNLFFNEYPQRLIDAADRHTGKSFNAIFNDSWEVGYQNWSQNFREEFTKLNGYDIIKWIPVLCGKVVQSADASEAVLHDLRHTIAHLIENCFYGHLQKLCHQNNLKYHSEVIYGGSGNPPLDVIAANTKTDLGIMEFWTSDKQDGFVSYSPKKKMYNYLASHASTIHPNLLNGAEAYTCGDVFAVPPFVMKPYGNLAYCSGVNQMIYHVNVHQPSEKKPGITLLRFGQFLNRHNPSWPQMDEFGKYHSRIQYILQQGFKHADILYYIGDAFPQNMDNDDIDSLHFGYQFTTINANTLHTLKTNPAGGIVLNENQIYKMLVIQNGAAMNFQTLKKIAALVKEGAVLFGNKPGGMLTLKDKENHQTEFYQLVNSLWPENSNSYNQYGKGKVFRNIEINEALKMAGITPDISTGNDDRENLCYIHKKTTSGDIYFIANQTTSTIHRQCTFAVTDKTPQLWNPQNGKVSEQLIFATNNNGITVPIELKPWEAKFIIFEKHNNALPHIEKVFKDGNLVFPTADYSVDMNNLPSIKYANGKYAGTANETGDYQLMLSDNSSLSVNLSNREIFSLAKSPCVINFLPEYESTIASQQITNYKSLHLFDNDDIKYFSGYAEYTIRFNLPKTFINSNDDYYINLPDFSSTATIILNDTELPSCWIPDYPVNIKGLLTTNNTLTIKVAILWHNRIMGDIMKYGEPKNFWTNNPINDYPKRYNNQLLPVGIIKAQEIIRYKSVSINH